MIAAISLVLIISTSMLVTRVAAIALTHTGLSRETARFQARSAFTGVGFTTSESEQVVNHPVRRRILLLLMLLGNAGIVTAASSLMLTFIDVQSSRSIVFKLFVLVSAIVILWAVAKSHWVDRRLSHLIDKALKRYTRLDVRDYVSLLHLAGDYRITELLVQPGDWLADRPLRELKLPDEGILVLGVAKPDGSFLGTPAGGTCLRPEYVVVLYGRTSELERLDQRRKGFSGDWEHDKAVEKQGQVAEAERQGISAGE